MAQRRGYGGLFPPFFQSDPRLNYQGITELKAEGERALKQNDISCALTMFNQALVIAQTQLWFRPIQHAFYELLCNRSEVYFRMERYKQAEEDAVSSIIGKPGFMKAYLRAAQAAQKRKNGIPMALDYILKGLRQMSHGGSMEHRVSLITELCAVVPIAPKQEQVHDTLRKIISLTPRGNKNLWEEVLAHLSNSGRWESISMLILGIHSGPKNQLERWLRNEKVNCQCVNVGTMLSGISAQELKDWGVELASKLIDFGAFPEEIPRNFGKPLLHVAVKLALQTEKLDLLGTMLHYAHSDHTLEKNIQDTDGNTVYHVLIQSAKTYNRCGETVLRLLLRYKCDPNIPNTQGKRPLDLLKPTETAYSMIEKEELAAKILQLNETGYKFSKSGNVFEAIQNYTKAINMTEETEGTSGLTKHEVAVLYGNRAETFLKLKTFKEALDDAKRCIDYASHWFKGHLIMGKAQKALGEQDVALQALISSYRKAVMDHGENTKIEIMKEITTVCVCMPHLNLHKRLPEFPRYQGHLWAKAAYTLISEENNWEQAAVAYFQFCSGEASKPHIGYSLKPLCTLSMLNYVVLVTDLIQFFLECGSDRKTIQLEEGQPYLHAVVIMTLKSERKDFTCFLRYILDNFTRKYREQNMVDTNGNSALHVAAKVEGVVKHKRSKVILMLLQAGVDPSIVNKNQQLVTDLLPDKEIESLDCLRKAIRSASHAKSQQNVKENIAEVYSEGVDKNNPEMRIQGHPEDAECHCCEECFLEGENLIKSNEIKKGYEKLLQLIEGTHSSEKHATIAQKAINLIVVTLGESFEPEIPNCLSEIKGENAMMITKGLATKSKWRQMCLFVRKYKGLNPAEPVLKNFANSMSVMPMLEDPLFINEEDTKLMILKTMIEGGATLGPDGGQTALKSSVECQQFKVIAELIMHGADTSQLSFTDGDTPIHAIMALVVEKNRRDPETLNVLEYALRQFNEDPQKYSHLDPNQVNENGDSLYHLAAKAKVNNMVVSATKLLHKCNVSSCILNKGKKPPTFYINETKDARLEIIRRAEPIQKWKNGKKINSDVQLSSDLKSYTNTQDRPKNAVKTSSKKVSKETRLNRIAEYVRSLHENKISFLNLDQSLVTGIPNNEMSGKGQNTLRAKKDPVGNKITSANKSACVQKEKKEEKEEIKNQDQHAYRSKRDNHSRGKSGEGTEVGVGGKNLCTQVLKLDGDHSDGAQANVNRCEASANGDVRGDAVSASAIESEESDAEETEEEIFIDAQVFDSLDWEVECTAEVWKTLRDKHVIPQLKMKIVKQIQQLASGDWQRHLCKPMTNVPSTLNLFESKLSKGRRILWELAVAFSPRCSKNAESRLQTDTEKEKDGKIYSEIIRVWDIVMDHDNLHRSVERIKKSHLRGQVCIIQKKLRGVKSNEHGASKRYPRLYAEHDVLKETLQEKQQEVQLLFPPASSNEREYHILKFFPFSSALVSHVLQKIETKADFPFRVTEREDAIIKLNSHAPILLLGRSGTGKTTCCLYRLWSEFHKYWSTAKAAGAADEESAETYVPWLPKFGPEVSESVDEGMSPDSTESLESKAVQSTPVTCNEMTESGPTCSLEATCEKKTEPEETEYVSASVEGTPDTGATEYVSASEESECCGEQKYDHLHQIFITKNAILRSELKKNFQGFCHGDDLLKDYVARKVENIPYRLEEVADYSYPLFLTSRELWLSLDASSGPPYFFARNDDGSPKDDIAGWTDDDGPLSVLTILDEDEDVDGDLDRNVNDDSDTPIEAAASKKVGPRREVTYEVFLDEVWPKIKPKSGPTYHPSLVWTEIMSFIKGSYQALAEESGFLEKEGYIDLGQKMAPNFSEERDTIYDIFKRYQHFKRQNSLFDETELVYHIFRRLNKAESRKWVIHQIYVDETQDFTQAELCLLIRLCQNPNSMFFTGDTAQSIMRGIAFRFSDLKSLFYHAKESMEKMRHTSVVKVPKQVYQLTHNYRSHAGILSLSSSVLELLVEFFPESFDRLKPDQGLFNGPLPILFESCSFSDLAVLLRGNRRKTSHIEFGAHQAILVVNDAAREKLPEELRFGLVLTISEAKGLEFDDVLLYNFFKDSQAGKEWRVVTEYLERSSRTPTEFHNRNDNLVKIDENVLRQSNRPRPLKFDQNLHKVLNSELKHLYTALTRARVNVWIFDEDNDKRAPMFEFFKARQLVKSLSMSDINEEKMSETMFAKKSSASDWVKRGDDFMKLRLYSAAAKCFEMGEAPTKQKVAVADGQALRASRLKENPQQMREEFLIAAELYIDCNNPQKVARCLKNAGKKELSAQLFKKLGQYEKAAEIYRQMKRPEESSECYEMIYQFHQALKVLIDHEHFELAIKKLRKYKKLIGDYRKSGAPIPQELIKHKPDDHLTEERLCYRAADWHHRRKDEEKMLQFLRGIHRLQDRVRFLQERGYTAHAADLLKENGNGEEAVKLLSRAGKIDDALSLARIVQKDDVIGQCLLSHSRVVMSETTKERVEMQATIENLEEAVETFERCHDRIRLGEAHLYLANLKKDDSEIQKAWKAFSNVKPFQNEAGFVECTDWLIRHGALNNLGLLRLVVKGIGHMFDVCKILLSTAGQEQIDKARLFDDFYGLLPLGPQSLQFSKNEKPICLPMIRKLLKDHPQRKQAQIEVSIQEAHESIVRFLLSRGDKWFKVLWEALMTWREKCLVCEYTVCGLHCEQQDNTDKPCRRLHKMQDDERFKTLMKVDVMMVELEHNISSGEEALRIKLQQNVIKDFVYLFAQRTKPKFQAAETLWEDIMPAFKCPAGQAAEFIQNLMRCENDKIRHHMHIYIKESWKAATVGEIKYQTEAAKSTNIFLMMEFGSRLFGLTQRNRGKIDPMSEIVALERLITSEVRQMEDPEVFVHRNKTELALMCEVRKKPEEHLVQCFGRRFSEAYTLISKDEPDPWDAIYKFSKFCRLLECRKRSKFFPELKHFLFWIEFYCTVAFFLIAKVNIKHFPDFMFVVPENYFLVLKFVEATFNKHTIEQGLVRWKPGRQLTSLKIQERLERIISLITAKDSKINLFKMVFQKPVKPDDFAIAERLLVFGMSLICNVGKTVSVKSGLNLLEIIRNISDTDAFPPRLKEALASLRNARGIKDVAKTLRGLLNERDNDVLTVCGWNVHGFNVKPSREERGGDTLFTDDFPILKLTPRKSKESDAEQEVEKEVEEGEMSDNEIEQGRKDQEQLIREQKAVAVISRNYKKLLEKRRKEKCATSAYTKQVHTKFGIFFVDTVEESNTMCGICGVSFEHQLSDGEAQQTGLSVGFESVQAQTLNNDLTLYQSMPSFPESKEGMQKSGMLPPEVKGSLSWQKHRQEQSHVQKSFDFHKFRFDSNEKVLPRYEKVNEFINNPDYQLKHVLTTDNYSEMRMDIDRLFGIIADLQKMFHKIRDERDWSQIGRLDQLSLEIWSDFERVSPYVIGIYNSLKRREGQASAAASFNAQPADYEDSYEEVETVVEGPKARLFKKGKWN